MKTLQRTLTLVKPDAIGKSAVGDIIEQFEKNGFRILAMKMLEISKHQAEQFYAVHASRPFYGSLTDFMSSGPIVALALEKENAIADLRKLMGATNPASAEEGTIRKKWASSIEHNAIHGSDAEDTARFELSFFFAGYELAQLATDFHGFSRIDRDGLGGFTGNWQLVFYANGSNHDAAGAHCRAEAQDRKTHHRCAGRRSRSASRRHHCGFS